MDDVRWSQEHNENLQTTFPLSSLSLSALICRVQTCHGLFSDILLRAFCIWCPALIFRLPCVPSCSGWLSDYCNACSELPPSVTHRHSCSYLCSCSTSPCLPSARGFSRPAEMWRYHRLSTCMHGCKQHAPQILYVVTPKKRAPQPMTWARACMAVIQLHNLVYVRKRGAKAYAKAQSWPTCQVHSMMSASNYIIFFVCSWSISASSKRATYIEQ